MASLRTSLLDAASRYAESHADERGIAKTPIRGLVVVRSTTSRDLEPVFDRASIALVLQGAMNAANGSRSPAVGPGATALLDPATPTSNFVARASLAEPFVAVMMEIDFALTAELSVELHATRNGAENTDDEVATAVHRLLVLLRRPQSVSVLLEPLLRELHYWVLAGKHGAAIRRLRKPDAAVSRVARAVALIRSQYRNALPVERLAKEAGMSTSAFHEHFRAATSMTPLQFQKQLRLAEARRLMVAEGRNASTAAFAVGYQSVPQFTREYRRAFGLPPGRETAPARSTATRQVSAWKAHLRRSAIALCPHVDEATALPA